MVKQLVSLLNGEDQHNQMRLTVVSNLTLENIGALGLSPAKCDELRAVLNSRGADYESVAKQVRQIISGTKEADVSAPITVDVNSLHG